ncbi:MAG: metallophosphoesterase [Candidatus Aenigmarchaeota archaeon]|nr:metallophosphoesterase [Candidatus Aenigmarchaeota archaeon]
MLSSIKKDIRFIINFPAMKIADFLVIADIHLGITREIYEAGVRLPSQVENLSDRINYLLKKTKTKNLIIIGDLRHRIPIPSFQEENEVPEFIRKINAYQIILVKGNHDGNIESLLNDTNVIVKPWYEISDYIFLHGHTKLPETSAKKIVIAHNHPGIKFKDKLGNSYVEPVWIKGFYDGRELIIMPCFNELAGTFPVNEKKEFHGPVAKKIELPRAYLIDGIELGLLESL